MSRLGRFAATLGTGLAVAGLGCVVPAAAQGSLAILAKLDRGSWEIRFRDNTPPRRVCLRDGSELIQLRHAGTCNRFIVENGTDSATVQYTCRGNGYGRTTLRRETSSLVQIDSQGIEGGRPFGFTAEARRTGACN